MKKSEPSAQAAYMKKKLHRLWDDKRTYKERLILAAVTAFSACFTFVFFGPVELTAFSQSSLVFNVKAMLPIMAVFAFLVFLILSFLFALLRGRLFDYVISILFSLLIGGYIQGNFLNGNLGALTGDTISWQHQKPTMLLNFFVWVLIFLAVFLLLYFSKIMWKKVLIFVSAALVLMHSVALVSIFAGCAVRTAADKDNYLTTANLSTFSSKHNTIVFLMDRLDYDYVEKVLKDKPDFFNKLDGFTSYTNAISEHARTKPAINYMFTNDDQMWDIPTNQYFEQSWDHNHTNILKDLKSVNYKIDFYTEIESMFGSGNTVKDYVSNLSSNKSQLSAVNLVGNVMGLSAYRYMPTNMKPFFWCYTDDVNKDIYQKSNIYTIDETKVDQLKAFDLDDSSNYFKFYHFMGPHTPYTLNADGTKSITPTDVVKQTEGSFNILYRALDKMKKLGIYKNATIIVSADHGDPVSDYMPLQKANRIGFFYKPSGIEGTPLKQSHAPISFKNIPATIAKSAGLDYHKYGKPVDEVGENDNVERYFYKSVVQDNVEKQIYTYQINGDAADFRNWKMTKVEQASYSFW